ncbi:guanine nucleotide exchange C9orf72 isoform X2 [Lingula anatina]|uniref:Guanine nucleotide exchange C9orf72 isoform X2 n=1 Tax=Lingula anatina TaxID=7574 RepID=A0A1S3HB39_LINAN|nr:guanine nucleotide exchange C9orf72 isoform X2 [Lingula anatina]|eukprot:XP_013383223.1 guanine nucleotide exchange C9orf72 isoform X2 [Lingula anatina]
MTSTERTVGMADTFKDCDTKSMEDIDEEMESLSIKPSEDESELIVDGFMVSGTFTDVASNQCRTPVIPSFEESSDTLVEGPDSRAISPVGHSLTATKLKVSSSNLIQAVVLSLWDNIVGPRILHVWKGEACNETVETFKYLSIYTLNGEICRDLTCGGIDTKFYVMSRRKLCVLALIFGAKGKCGPSVHCLSVVMSSNDLQKYVTWQRTLHAWLKRRIAVLRVLMEKDEYDKGIHFLNASINKTMRMLQSLQLDGLPSCIKLEDTYFYNEDSSKDFLLRKSITSHLMTCGRSVVTGTVDSEINKMVSTLALFNTSAERQCSRFCSHERNWPYHHDLCVQGWLPPSYNLRSVLDKIPLGEMQCAEYPTSIIDVKTHEVRQTLPVNEHHTRRHDFLSQEVTHPYSKHDVKYPEKNILDNLQYPENLVHRFMKELFAIPVGLRLSFIQLFIRTIERKALVLIKSAEVDSDQGRSAPKTNPRKLRQDLGLQLEGDFRIVLAMAEKLKPGIYTYLLGDSLNHELARNISLYSV